jgi:diketogulonate reductase-like aldo/keto reductase
MHAWEFAKALDRQKQHGWARFAATDGAYADLLYTPVEAAANKAVIDAVGTIAAERDVSRAQVALAWLHSRWSPRRWSGPTRPPRSTTPSHRRTSS